MTTDTPTQSAHWANVERGPAGAADRLQALAAVHVDDALRPFLMGPDKRAFAPRGLQGAVAYGQAGRVVVGIGDPIGPDGWIAFDLFVARAGRHHLTVGMYQTTQRATEALVQRGFRVVPVGQEAVVDLARFDLGGSRRANLRHTITRARRGGVSVEWHPAGIDPHADALLTDMAALDAAWSERAGPSMGFTISRFRSEMLCHTATAIALDADHRPLAFATFRECGPGSYVLDVIRRRPDSTPGALEACIAEAATQLGRAGMLALSLGLAPLAGLDVAAENPEERWLARGANAIRGAYDVDGLTFFKSKFDPEWRTRYLAVPSRRAFPLVASSLLWLHLAGDDRRPIATGVVVSAGMSRAMAAEYKARWKRDGPRLKVAARERATVAVAAGAATWLGGRFGSNGGRRSTLALAAGGAAVVLGVAAGSRRARSVLASGLTAGQRSGPLPRITVLVPGRNEETVLPQLIRDLGAQDHRDNAGAPCFDVIVIDDRSSDQTLSRSLEAAREAGLAGVVSVRARRGRNLPSGKGAALTFVAPEDCAEIIVVLDADARLQPSVLGEVARLVADGLGAFTIRRRIDTSSGSWLAQAQADEQALDAAAEEAHWALGSGGQFRGNGIVIRRDLLIAAGGWRAVLTEDLDLSSRLAIRTGVRVAWPVSPSVQEQPAHEPRSLWRQRLRWAEGAIRAAVEWTPAEATTSASGAARRLGRLRYPLQLLLPFVAIGAAVNGTRRRRIGAALAIPLAGYAVAAALTFDALGRLADAPVPAPRARFFRSARAAGFLWLWLAAVPRATIQVVVGRGPLRYDQTRHADARPSRTRRPV